MRIQDQDELEAKAAIKEKNVGNGATAFLQDDGKKNLSLPSNLLKTPCFASVRKHSK